MVRGRSVNTYVDKTRLIGLGGTKVVRKQFNAKYKASKNYRSVFLNSN